MAEKLEQLGVFSTSLLVGSDEIFDNICQPCTGDNKTLEAVGFCVDCSEFLCDECYRYHLKPPLTRNHKLLDIEEAKKDTSITSRQDICTEKCSHHSGKTIEYLCPDHCCLGCVACITIDHRNCQGVLYIPKVAKDTGNGEVFTSLIEELEKVLLQTKLFANTYRTNKLKYQGNYDKVLNHVKQVRKDVNDAMDKLENEIVTEAGNRKLQEMQKADRNITSCDTIQSKTEALTSKLKEMKEKGHYSNLFVAMETSKTEIRSVVQSLADMSNDTFVHDYLFQPGLQLENFLQHRGSHGKLCEREGTVTKAIWVGEMSVKMESDAFTCYVTGLAVTTNGLLVAADSNNRKVKLIEIKQHKVISEYQLKFCPFGITMTGEEDEIAVSFHDKILLLKIRDNRLISENEIKTPCPFYGIACINDTFVLSPIAPAKLQIIDKQGKVLHTIDTDKNGKKMFEDARTVAVSHDRDTVFVADYGKDVVTRLSLTGHAQGIYRDNDLKGARGVTVDKRGTVYVCGFKSENVHQVTPDCEKIRILLTKQDGLDSPISLCYDGITDRLYVGQVNDKVLVYQLS